MVPTDVREFEKMPSKSSLHHIGRGHYTLVTSKSVKELKEINANLSAQIGMENVREASRQLG